MRREREGLSECVLGNQASPLAAMAPSKKPLETVSRGQLVSKGLMGGGGCSSWALGSTSGIYQPTAIRHISNARGSPKTPPLGVPETTPPPLVGGGAVTQTIH